MRLKLTFSYQVEVDLVKFGFNKDEFDKFHDFLLKEFEGKDLAEITCIEVGDMEQPFSVPLTRENIRIERI